MAIPIVPIVTAALSWLSQPSDKMNRLIPKSIGDGALSIVASIATKRYVLLVVLVGLSIFGTNRSANEAALSEYVTQELGIRQSLPLTTTKGDEPSDKYEDDDNF
jgi:hypothetical protein